MIHGTLKRYGMAALALLTVVTGCSRCDTVYQRKTEVNAAEARQLLAEGNGRFVSGAVLNDVLGAEKRHDLAVKGQKPFAIILSCSDSRVPPEIIFDQGLGDLFVVRNAGNVVDAVVLGSIEYAAEHLKTPLIVVLGHEKCGAVKATVDGGVAPGSIEIVVDLIQPSLDRARKSEKNKDALYEKVTLENVRNSISRIRRSPVIRELLKEKKIEIVGAQYHIETGIVEFLGNK